MKISSWTRHDHNTMPPASKTTGNYVNSSLAKVEALKAGYDEALMLNPQGFVSECTGENIFVARHGRLITPPRQRRRPRGHHPGHGDPPGQGHGLRGRVRRAHPQRPLRRRRDVRGRHRRRGERGELRRRPRDPVPRPDDQGDRRGVRRASSAARSTSTRTGWSCAHDATSPATSRSSTRRCATGRSSRASRLTVEDKLKVAEQLDWLGVAWIEGGYPQANPKDEEFFRRAVTELRARDGHARGLRLHPPAGRARSTSTRRSRRSCRPARPRCASSARAGTST